MIVVRKFHWNGKDYFPGDPVPKANPAWIASWLAAGSITEEPFVPSPDAPEARMVSEPGEEVITQSGTQITDRIPDMPGRKKKK